MNNVMSKFLAMGVPLEDVIRRSTVNPAKEIHRPDLGTLSIGQDADIAVLELTQGHFSYIDCGVAKMDANVRLIGPNDDPCRTHFVRSFRSQHGAVGESASAVFYDSRVARRLPARADDYPRD